MEKEINVEPGVSIFDDINYLFSDLSLLGITIKNNKNCAINATVVFNRNV
jgi:hypothetical protein